MERLAEIRRLWQEVFNDSRAWMTEVFPRICRPDETLTLHTDGIVTSMLLLRRATMIYRGVELPTAYIYGAATDKRYRGKGGMTRLLHKALIEAYDRGDVVATLRPARPRLYEYYCRRGFSTVFYTQEHRYTAVHRWNYDEDAYIIETQCSDANELAIAYNRLSALTRQAYIAHYEGDMRTVLIDLSMDSRMIAIVRHAHDMDICAIAFAGANDSELRVYDLVAENEHAANAALAALTERAPGRLTVVDIYPTAASAYLNLQPRAMARIVNVKAYLEAIAEIDPKLHCVVRTSDSIIAANNATYVVGHGKVSVAGTTEQHIDIDVTVETLTAIAFSAPHIGEIFSLPTARPWMSLMID